MWIKITVTTDGMKKQIELFKGGETHV